LKKNNIFAYQPEKKNCMKRSALLSIILLIALSSFAQFDWTKYGDNFVLTHGPDNFDLLALGQPSILFEEGVIRMWYPGVGSDGKARLCYATSTDGIEWTKHGVAMDVGGDGEWDRGWIDTPDVLKTDDGYVLVYYGDTVQQLSEINSSMGVAYSADGISWTKYAGNPVFSKANIGDWDGTWVESPALFWDEANERIMMYYNGVDTATWKIQIGLAYSDDGSVWSRYEGNPLITHGNWGDVDDMWCGTPAVLNRNGKFEMWYASTQAEDFNPETYLFDVVSICYASSIDGVSWTKYDLNPLFDTYSEPHNPASDIGGPWAPDVIFNENTQQYMMWYEAHGGVFDYGFSLATAPVDFSEISNPNEQAAVKIFPNPATDLVTVILPDDVQNAKLYIYDLQGRCLFNKVVVGIDKIQISHFSNGMYLYKIVSGNQSFFGKFVKE
jgi:hypothetical protein